MNERQRPAWKGAVALLTVLASLIVMGGQLTNLFSVRAAGTDDLLGPDLIQALAVKPTSYPVEGCDYLAEVDGTAYCLDAHVSNVTEFRLLAMRMRGHEPSGQDVRLVELMAKAEAIQNDMSSGAQARLRHLVQEARHLIDAGATSTG